MAYINTGTTIVLLSPTDKPSIIQDEIYKLGIDYLVGPSELVNVLKVASYTIAPSHRIMFFTSGTTSKAKAVVLNEYNQKDKKK